MHIFSTLIHISYLLRYFINLTRTFFLSCEYPLSKIIFFPCYQYFLPNSPTCFAFSQYTVPMFLPHHIFPNLSRYIFHPLTHIFPPKMEYFLFTSNRVFYSIAHILSLLCIFFSLLPIFLYSYSYS